MSPTERRTEWLDGFRAGVASGRVAHAYLLTGSSRGEAGALAESLLQVLFCERTPPPCGRCGGCRRVRERAHPDARWIEPESKSRRIRIEVLREQVLPFVGRTSFSGGWKAVVLLDADRMTDQAANAFLKALEEPPPRTLLLLTTERPQDLLPTVSSRCQRMGLAAPGCALPPERMERLLEVLARGASPDPLRRLAATAALSAMLDDVRTAAAKEAREGADGEEPAEVLAARANARVLEVRRDLLEVVERWQRDVLLCVAGGGADRLAFPAQAGALRRQAADIDYAEALRRVAAVGDIHRRLERHLGAETAFDAFFLSMRFPRARAAR